MSARSSKNWPRPVPACVRVLVTVTRRALRITEQGYRQWLASPVPRQDWDDAHPANAAYDVHADDP